MTRVHSYKKLLIAVLKITLSVAILGYLVWDAARSKEGINVFGTMLEQPKRWDLLGMATVGAALGVLLTLFRWCYLVRALGIPLTMRDALRIGLLGYLFNLAPMGIVGGDLLKAFLLAREHPGNRAKALASVVVDRVIGLYVLFVVASVAILLTGYSRLPIPQVQVICRAVLLVTAIGTALIGILLLPSMASDRWGKTLARIPRAGAAIASLVGAIQMYRRNLGVLGVTCLMSVAVHCVFTLSVYLVARGLPGDVLSLKTHFVVYPISSAAGVLPLPAGPFEAVLEFLYTHSLEEGIHIPKLQGLVVALVYRLITILLAAFAFVYYLTSRREVAEVIQETRDDPDAGSSTSAPASITIE